jgi:hypothetical protein
MSLYESWESQKSMQALLFSNTYAAVGAGEGSQGIGSDSSDDGDGGTSTGAAALDGRGGGESMPMDSNQGKNVSHSHQRHPHQQHQINHKRNRTEQIPSLQHHQRQHLPQHVQRIAEQEQQQQHDSNNNIKNDNDDTNEKKKEPLNIVLFYADDWTMKTLAGDAQSGRENASPRRIGRPRRPVYQQLRHDEHLLD